MPPIKDDEPQITIPVVIDTGNVDKGLDEAQKKVGAAGEKITRSFKTSTDGVKKSAQDVLNSFDEIDVASSASARGLLNNALRLTPALAAVAAGGFLIKQSFDLAKEGESLEKTRGKFEALSQSANVYSTGLIKGLEESAQGLYDNTELMEVANTSLVRLGEGASQLPQLFTLARKATEVFGGDAVQNLQTISDSIASANTKQLKYLGLTVDSDRALTKYAASIGTTKEALSEQSRQQAILNAVLEAGSKRFKDISLAVNDKDLDDGQKRIASSTKALHAALASIANSNLGSTYAGFLNGIAGAIKTLAISFDSLAGKPLTIDSQFKQLNAQLARYQELQKLNPNVASQYDAEIARLKELINTAKGVQTAITSAEQKNSETGPRKLSTEELIAGQLKVSEFNARLVASNKSALDAMAQNQKVAAQGLVAQIASDNQSKLVLEQEFNKKILEIKLQASKGEISGSQSRELIAAETAAYDAQIASVQRKIVESQDAIEEQNGAFIYGFTKNLNFGARTLELFVQNANLQLRELGANSSKVLVAGFGNSFFKMGQAIRAGTDAFSAFRDAMIGVFSDIASIAGDTFIKMGVGYLFFNPALGVGLIAAGAALKLFAGLIAPSGGGGGSTGLSASDSSYASAVDSSTGFGGTTEKAKPETNIQIVVQGNILDSDGSAQHLVKSIQEHFDTTGSRFSFS